MPRGREIRLVEVDRGWSAIDRHTGVASQGPTRREALENLDEIVELTAASRVGEGDSVERPPPDVP